MTELIDTTDKPVKASEMTLRDYFAAKAMQGIIGSSNWRDCGMKLTNGLDLQENIAQYGYQVADAMLKERNK